MQNPFGEARFLLSVAQLDQLPAADRPEIAFAGRSNAGKSSALNAICGQRNLARVSKTPGRTQLLNFFELPSGRLVDLPGYGFADVPQEVRRQWGPLITGYLRRRESLAGIVLIMDIRHPLTDFDRQMLSWAGEIGQPVLVLLTKSDKLTGGAARQVLKTVQAEIADVSVQLFSSQTRGGVEEARSWLAARLKGEAKKMPGESGENHRATIPALGVPETPSRE